MIKNHRCQVEVDANTYFDRWTDVLMHSQTALLDQGCLLFNQNMENG